MQVQEPVRVARDLIERHGIRASAVAEERALEARLAGNTTELDLWGSVRLAIQELRTTAPRPAA